MQINYKNNLFFKRLLCGEGVPSILNKCCEFFRQVVVALAVVFSIRLLGLLPGSEQRQRSRRGGGTHLHTTLYEKLVETAWVINKIYRFDLLNSSTYNLNENPKFSRTFLP